MRSTRGFLSTVLGGVVALAGTALANPVSGTYVDLATGCDSHGPQIAYDELGTGVAFPQNELILALSVVAPWSPCPSHDDGTSSWMVFMTNLTGQAWSDLYYVADPETYLTNVDGLATSAAAPGTSTLAFRIDAIGMNKPLFNESILADGIFQPGETWEFVIQNYSNSNGLLASQMDSLDFAGASGGDHLSSGSVVAMKRVPAPASMVVVGVGGLLAARRRR